MKGFKCGSNGGILRDANDSAGICIFNLLKAFNLCERKSVVKSYYSQDESRQGKWR